MGGFIGTEGNSGLGGIDDLICLMGCNGGIDLDIQFPTSVTAPPDPVNTVSAADQKALILAGSLLAKANYRSTTRVPYLILYFICLICMIPYGTV